MLALDVNVLVYAHRADVPEHERYLEWLEQLVNGDEAFGLADLVLSGFIRVATHSRVFKTPTPIEQAVAFAEQLRKRPNRIRLAPGSRHWAIFLDLCRRANARGNLVADAYLAAMAIESGCEWVSADRDFARFPGLRWRHPLG